MEPSVLALVASFVGRKQETLNCSVAKQTTPNIKRQTSTRIEVIIFTKDRPWQLQQLFRSMSLTTTTTTIAAKTATVQQRLIVDIIVIGIVQDIYCAAYKQVEGDMQ